MPTQETRRGARTRREHAVLLNRRQRRRGRYGPPDLFRTHDFGPAAVATIDTDVVFPGRGALVTFHAAIVITADGSVATEHRGLAFEFGSATRGCALWVGDETIGFHAGLAGTADGATALFDFSAELPVGRRFELVAAVNAGNGQVRLWDKGLELARATATNGDFGPGDWADTGDGSVADDPNGTVVTDVPAASRIAPDGFAVVEPVSVFLNQKPHHFA